MELNEKDIEALAKIREFENTVTKEQWPVGWTWRDVKVYSATLNKLLIAGLIVCVYKSHSSTNYELTEAGKSYIESDQKPPDEELRVTTLPKDIFSEIVGYDNVKELLRESLLLDKPVHILLYGPPSLSKTLILWCIEQAGGENTMWLIGSATSKAGMWDLIAERRPRWLLVDELEKMSVTDMAGLLSLMERGRLVRTKVGRRLDERLTVWVIAAANKIARITPELLSRFAKVELKQYTTAEYHQVVINVLLRHEGMNEELAAEVANRLIMKTQDVRDAIRVARLSKRVGVKRAVELLLP